MFCRLPLKADLEFVPSTNIARGSVNQRVCRCQKRNRHQAIDIPKLPGKIDCRQRDEARRRLVRSRSGTRKTLPHRNMNS
jgi:hypothetical protein